MTDSDKTVVLDSASSPDGSRRCPACGALLQLSDNGTDSLRCPVCGFAMHRENTISMGSVIGGKYRILNHLNSGGVGALFFCYPLEDPSTRYVLKILKLTDAASRLRFRREAYILESIGNTDRIAKLVDVLESGDDVFIIMEYIKGKNLKQLRSEYVFDEEAVLQVAGETARTLQYIWETYSIIHRDIKPENIMLDEDFHLKLLDFGLSKHYSGGHGTEITVANLGLETPGYMSPEQFKDSRSVDFRADIFSLGATMFFLLTGKPLFAGRTAMEICKNTLRSEPPAASHFDGTCSPGCIAMIQRMVQANRNERYQTYGELLADIQRLLPRH